MRNERWGTFAAVFFFFATIGLAAVIGLVLPRDAEQWTGAAMAAWILFGSVLIAANRASHSGNGFWQLTFFLAAILSWFVAYPCAKSWNLDIFGPNSAMLMIFAPISAPAILPPLFRLLRENELHTPINYAELWWSRRSFMVLYVIAITHLVLRFNQTTVSTKIFLAFFALVSIAAWKMPVRIESANTPNQLTA
jgi:hypothetical protein